MFSLQEVLTVVWGGVGEGQDGEGFEDLFSLFSFLLCPLKQNQTPDKKQTQEDSSKGAAQVTQWVDNLWNITESVSPPGLCSHTLGGQMGWQAWEEECAPED